MSDKASIRAERIAQIRALLDQRVPQVVIASKVGMCASNLCTFIHRHGLRTWKARNVRKDRSRVGNRNDDYGWGRERLDPSNLTQDQLDQARRLGITPGRYAWLLTCPRSGNYQGLRAVSL